MRRYQGQLKVQGLSGNAEQAQEDLCLYIGCVAVYLCGAAACTAQPINPAFDPRSCLLIQTSS